MNRKKNRSDRYQNIFAEQACSNEMMAEFADNQGLTSRTNPELKERLLDLNEQLLKEFWRLVRTKLTDRQRQVMELYADGKTQIEIAKLLHVNQSSITKSINGNCDYRNGKKVYGGAKKKLRRLAEKDEKIKTIFALIAEVESEYDSW
jgi:DNA-binding CsgD family transcriptional regulator